MTVADENSSPDPYLKARYAYALALIGKENYPAAVQVLQDIIIADRLHADARNDLGVLYYQKAQYAEAKRHLSAALLLKPGDAVIAKNLIEAHLKTGQWDEAARLCEEIMAAGKADNDIYMKYGYALAKLDSA